MSSVNKNCLSIDSFSHSSTLQIKRSEGDSIDYETDYIHIEDEQGMALIAYQLITVFFIRN